jgi:hypothetical protein
MGPKSHRDSHGRMFWKLQVQIKLAASVLRGLMWPSQQLLGFLFQYSIKQFCTLSTRLLQNLLNSAEFHECRAFCLFSSVTVSTSRLVALLNFCIATVTAGQRTLSTWHLRALANASYGAGGSAWENFYIPIDPPVAATNTPSPQLL